MAKLLDFVFHDILHNIVVYTVVNDVVNVIHNSFRKVINCLKT